MDADPFDAPFPSTPAEILAFVASVLESASQYSIVTLDLEGRILLWSEGARSIYGYEPQEVIGKEESFLYAPSEQPGRANEIRKLVLEVGKWEGTVQRRRKDGRTFPAGLVMTLRRDPDQRIAGFLFMSQDLSLQTSELPKQATVGDRLRTVMESALRQSEDKFARAFRSSPDSIAINTVAEGRYVEVNDGFCRMTGYSREEVIGRTARELGVWVNPADRDRMIAELEQSGTLRGFEFQFRTKSGEVRTGVRSAERILMNGTPCIIGTTRDITEQKRADAALREAQEQLNLFVMHAPAAIAMLDSEMNYIAASNRWYADYGLPNQNIIGRNHYEVFPDIPERWKMIHRRCLAGAVERNDADLWLRADGGTDWVRWEIRPWHTAGDTIGGLIIFSEIITDRISEHEALQSSEQKFRALAETAAAAIFISRDDRFLYVNRQTEVICGRSREQLLGRMFWEVIHPEDRTMVRDRRQRRLAGLDASERYEFRILSASGETRWIDFTAAVIQFEGAPAVLGTAVDVTARRKAEETLRLQAAALESAANAIVVVDLDGQISWVNPAFVALTGYSAEEAIGQNPRLLNSGRHKKEFFKTMWTTVLAGKVWRGEMWNRRKDGSIYREDQTITPVADEAGRVSHFIAIKQDVTEQERARDTLRRQADIFKNLYDAVLVIDETGRIVDCNDAAVTVYGYSREQLVGQPVAMLQTPELAESTRHSIETGLRTQKRWAGEVSFVHADGHHRICETFVQPLRVEDGRVTLSVGVSRDITEHRQLEEQLRQAQKMEALGQLAGGVAHDFNNLLGVILGYGELLAAKTLPGPDREALEEIRMATQRAAALTRQLLAFSRKQILDPADLDLNALLGDVAKLLQRLMPENIGLQLRPAPNLWHIRADRGQIEQVVMNLAVNARDAMPRGGTLIVETKNVTLSSEYAEKKVVAKPGPYVMLAVTDTGTGMDAETQAKIFEPFFTTKGPGKGTGLGLATVYGIVKQSEGFIWVYSEPNRGTTFKVYLPRVEPSTPSPAHTETDAAVRGGSETVMIVEDVASLRTLFVNSLAPMGYKVLTAENGARALEVADLYDGAIDLLITDVVMPIMSGRELAAFLGAERPGIKVLYVTGYTDDAIVHHGVLEPGVELLQKPFGPVDLQRKVRQILDASRH